jgi:hypothetical protein
MGHKNPSSASVSSQKIQRENHQGAEIAESRSEAPTLGQGTSNNSRGAGGNGIDNYGDGGSRLPEAERTALLRSKQAELDAIEDRHDDLVRSCLLHCPFPLRALAIPHAFLRLLPAGHVGTRSISFRTVDHLGYL